jgi:hypothetical protein
MHPEDLQVNISMKKVQPSIHRINLHLLSGTFFSRNQSARFLLQQFEYFSGNIK